MTRKLILGNLFWFFLFFLNTASAQILDPVGWEFEVKEISANEYELIFTAEIDKGYHLYSVNVDDGGPLPTEFIFEDPKGYKTDGNPIEYTKGHTSFDKTFEMNIKYFDDEAVFGQKIKFLGDKKPSVKGYISYMVCNDKGCVPLEEDFNFPFDETSDIGKNTNQTGTKSYKNTAEILKDKSLLSDIPDTGLLPLLFFAFLAGLAAILTPCVFPMIPMTVSFFMKEGDNKAKGKFQAIFFGFSIIAIYTIIGTIVAVTLGVNFANWLSTHWIPNVLFFLIFVFFAASFFGMFELTLPSWLINKSDKQSEKGGLIGAFFMAFTLVLVSFSCTGPLVGAILVKAASGAWLEPIVGMLGFSLAFALPFTLFAFFPKWLNKMPKSGGWLNSVKVILGFIELALGLKFLSIADQTYHWGILDREIYLAFWIIIFVLMGFYLLGKIKFAHDSDVKFVSVPRLFMVIITFTFVLYLTPGMFGAPLKALSGYLPPMTSHDFDLNTITRENSLASNYDHSSSICEIPKYHEFLHLPHGLQGYYDYNQGLACAKKLNKPIFMDFTGHGCVNCREMEANVWSDPKVLKRLREEYLIITLYVDDKTPLPETDWVKSSYDGKIKKTVGKIFADLQIHNFNINAQPYYVLLDHDGELLSKPISYDLDVDKFVSFLDEGIENFKNK